MDLVSPAIAGAVGYVGRWLLAAARANHVKMPALDIDLAIAVGELADDGLLLDVSQVAEVQAFLEHPATQAVLRLSALESLARGSRALQRTEITAETLSTHFRALASSWCEQASQTWADAADEVWSVISARQNQLLRPLVATVAPETSDIAVERFFFSPLSADHVPRYINVLLEVAANPDLLAALSRTLSHARTQLQGPHHDEFDVHGDETTASFHDLYVNRTLIDAASGEERPAESVLDATDHAIRAVVIGDPGTGKSTLVKWFRWRLSTTSESSVGVPVTVICRQELASRDATVLAAIARTFEREYGFPVAGAELDGLLSAGALVVVFDGLDEIQNRDQRTSVVNQIKALERSFPMAPILCTTRRTGSEVSMFRDSPFRVLSLEQYSGDQVSEYVARWFGRKGHAERAQRFLGESRDLEDLRQNPLMLALLCALYSQQDYIPQSRREVYVRCAALMFREWDPRRGIDIPNIFKNRGDQALQAIATRLDRSGGYGQVLTRAAAEGVVRDVLTRAGIEAMEAQASAKELIDHCATRAWILSVSTTPDGERAVGFTHRTFFEFFAAEARVREINRQNVLGAKAPQPDSLPITPITRAVLEPFWRDPTSVMPELIMQAADDIMGGVSPVVLDELVKLAKYQGRARASEYVGLAVRLLAATGGETGHATAVLTALADLWRRRDDSGRGDAYGMDAFRSLLDIPSAHRAIFRGAVLDDGVLAREFARRYAVLEAAEETGLYSSDWKALARGLPPIDAEGDALLAWFEVKRGARDATWGVESVRGRDLFRVRAGESVQSGVFWEWLRGAPAPPDAASRRILLKARRGALVVPYGRSLVDSSLVPIDSVSLTSAPAGCLDLDLALVLIALTLGDADRTIERVTGLELQLVADVLREAAATVAGNHDERNQFRSLRAEVRRAYSSVGEGEVPKDVWRAIGLG